MALKPSGVIIENTFISLPTLIPEILPMLPKLVLPVLLTEKWDANLTVPRIPHSTPMLFLAGRRDELVPPSHMKALLTLRGKGKARWRDFDGGHNDTCIAPGYWEAIREWMTEEIEGQGSNDDKAEIGEKEVEKVRDYSSDEDKKGSEGWEKVEMNFEVESKKEI